MTGKTEEGLEMVGLSLLLKVLIASAALFPAYSVVNNNSYFTKQTLPGCIIVFLLGWYLLFCPKKHFLSAFRSHDAGRAQKISSCFVAVFGAVLFIYNIICYCNNGLQHIEYWDQIHYTLGFLLIIFFIAGLTQKEAEQMKLFRFLMIILLLSLLCSFLCYYSGFQSLNIRWTSFSANILDPESRLGLRSSWLWPHKSQFALVLLMSFFAIIRHWRRFPHPLLFIGMAALLLYSMYLCNTLAAFGAVLAGLTGLLLDFLFKKQQKLRFKLLVLLGGAAALGAAAYVVWIWISRNRNISTLGSRTGIWQGSIQRILENPNGVGNRFAKYVSIPVIGYEWNADNCHNIFFNHALRYGIPAGVLFACLFLLLILYTVWYCRSFYAAGCWVGILMVLNMDYSLVPSNFPCFILLVFVLFILRPPVSRNPQPGTIRHREKPLISDP